MSNWKEELRALNLNYIKNISYSFWQLSGGDKMKLKPHNDNSTTALCSAISAWLKYSGYIVEPMPAEKQAKRIRTCINNVSVTIAIRKTLPAIAAQQSPILQMKNTETRITRVEIGSMEAFIEWLEAFRMKNPKPFVQAKLFA